MVQRGLEVVGGVARGLAGFRVVWRRVVLLRVV